jgi:competence protein ComEA
MKLKSLFFAVFLSFVSFSASAEIVNLNKADASALQHYLKGVGEKKALNIVKYRKQHKKFEKIEEIKEVKGIGEKLYKKIKSSLSLTKGVVSAPSKGKAKSKKKVVKKAEQKVKSKKKTKLKKKEDD